MEHLDCRQMQFRLHCVLNVRQCCDGGADSVRAKVRRRDFPLDNRMSVVNSVALRGKATGAYDGRSRTWILRSQDRLDRLRSLSWDFESVLRIPRQTVRVLCVSATTHTTLWAGSGPALVE